MASEQLLGSARIEDHKHVSAENFVGHDSAGMYDAIGVNYELLNYEDAGRRKALLWGVDRLKEHLKSVSEPNAPIRCLDLGCASGKPGMQILSDEISKITSKPIDILGLDTSPGQLKLAESYDIPNSRFILSDMRTFEPEHGHGSLDLVVSFYALNHLPFDHMKDVLHKVASWLKPPSPSIPGGIFVLGMVANVFGMVKWQKFDVCADTFLSLDEGKSVCEASGFEVLEVWEETFYPTLEHAKPKLDMFFCCRKT